MKGTGLDNIENIENPEEELSKLDRVISQYKLILRSSADIAQKERAVVKIKSLAEHRDKLLQMFTISQTPSEANGREEGAGQAGPTYLPLVMQSADDDVAGRGAADGKASGRGVTGEGAEIEKLGLYLRFFDQEFLRIFSGRRLRLDFQHSLERDGYYSRFQELARKLEDIVQEIGRSNFATRAKKELDLRMRISRMNRALSVEADKYFNAVVRFVADLVEDLDSGGVKCLNGDEHIHFDKIEGKRFLEGETVHDALVKSREFSFEMLKFLNVPEFNSQEQ